MAHWVGRFVGNLLKGQTVGIIGAGRIGTAYARMMVGGPSPVDLRVDPLTTGLTAGKHFAMYFYTHIFTDVYVSLRTGICESMYHTKFMIMNP